MLPPRHTLSKKERICCKNDISRLFEKGRFSSTGFLRFCVLQDNGLPYSRIMVSVPKKLFRRAVKRNLLKRRIRESYRLQKHILESNVDMMIIYSSREIMPFSDIYGAVGSMLETISGSARQTRQTPSIKDNDGKTI